MVTMASSGLTAEQLRRIEENKKKALAKRGLKFSKSTQPAIADRKPDNNNAPTHYSRDQAIVNNSSNNSSKDYNDTVAHGRSTQQGGSAINRVNVQQDQLHITARTVKVGLGDSSGNKRYALGGKLKEPVTKTVSSAETTVHNSAETIIKSNAETTVRNSAETTVRNSVETTVRNSAETLVQNSAETVKARDLYTVGQSKQVSNNYYKELNDVNIVRNNSNEANLKRIEQNRLKALAKRAERLNKSPKKDTNDNNLKVRAFSSGTATVDKAAHSLIINHQKDTSKPVTLNKQNIKNTAPVSTVGTSLKSNLSSDTRNFPSHSLTVGKPVSDLQGPSISCQDQLASLCPSSTEVWNAFGGLGQNTVKGGCLLVARGRFEVHAGYSAPLIQLFKSMTTKLYVTTVRCLKPAVEIEPLPRAILQAFSTQLKGQHSTREIPMADLSKVEPTLVNSLMSFQRAGVNFGVYKNGRVLIADDMGLGKTIQAICLSCYYRDEWPLLIVVPSSVRFDWAQNFRRWVPSLDPQVINVVVTGKENCTSGLINILSYDLMAKKATELRQKRFQVIIMDECHLLKNHKTARCKAAMPLMQNARRVILLSGTPALSRPSELYTQISAICPFLFKFHDFGVRYCDGKQLPWGWDYSGSSNMAELQLLLEEKIMIRRLKTEVLAELPDKIRQMVLLDPGSVKIGKALTKASEVLNHSNLKKTKEHGALLDFFHKSGTAKMKAIKNYVEDLMEEGKKFLIFAHHGDVLDGIETVVKSKIENNYMRIDGKTSSEYRNLFCQKFQHSDAMRVAILSITAANAGLNLSAASLVVFAELFWNPGILVQAEDRVHRIGQQDSVVVRYLVATGTSDDHIWPMIQKKLDVLGKAGLTKDNFSSAETTRLKDDRQEEITKFLEESFCSDLGGTEAELEESLCGEAEGPEFESHEMVSPTKGLKQRSILNYTSPMKNIPIPILPCTPPKKEKEKSRGLLKYFTPEKKQKSEQNSTKSTRPSGSCSSKGHIEKSSQSEIQSREDKGQCVKGQSVETEVFEVDLEEFLKDSDDDWEQEECTPPIKKRKTQFQPPFIK